MENTDINLTLARNLRHYLSTFNMTQEQLAQKIGVSSQAVSFWCSGKKSPRMDKIDKMCKVFNCSRSDLISNVRYTFNAASGGVDVTFAVEQKEPALKQKKIGFSPRVMDYMSNVEINDSFKVPNVDDFLLEHQFYMLLKKLNTKGQKKVYQFALDLTKDPTYQSEELINETKEMFQKYIKAGLIAEVKEAGSDDN